jgi:hypothetical protein
VTGDAVQALHEVLVALHDLDERVVALLALVERGEPCEDAASEALIEASGCKETLRVDVLRMFKAERVLSGRPARRRSRRRPRRESEHLTRRWLREDEDWLDAQRVTFDEAREP